MFHVLIDLWAREVRVVTVPTSKIHTHTVKHSSVMHGMFSVGLMIKHAKSVLF